MSDALPLNIQFTCTAAPVQAEGTVAGREFYFRARGELWSFTIAERTDHDPATLGPEDVATGLAWYRSGTVSGGRFAASYLSLEEARSLIYECARAYLDEYEG
jgi:hypothetical protein